MPTKSAKKVSVSKISSRLKKASAKSKMINWNKYFGKIKFPVDALSYQQQIRDEWN